MDFLESVGQKEKFCRPKHFKSSESLRKDVVPFI